MTVAIFPYVIVYLATDVIKLLKQTLIGQKWYYPKNIGPALFVAKGLLLVFYLVKQNIEVLIVKILIVCIRWQF